MNVTQVTSLVYCPILLFTNSLTFRPHASNASRVLASQLTLGAGDQWLSLTPKGDYRQQVTLGGDLRLRRRRMRAYGKVHYAAR